VLVFKKLNILNPPATTASATAAVAATKANANKATSTASVIVSVSFVSDAAAFSIIFPPELIILTL
jgi:hypothetical protein